MSSVAYLLNKGSHRLIRWKFLFRLDLILKLKYIKISHETDYLSFTKDKQIKSIFTENCNKYVNLTVLI